MKTYKTYYIPTSTLNFPNILSTESISPKSFYEKRTFGMKRWQPVSLNCGENHITLYDKLVGFECPQSDLEDHPLLVEICLTEESELKHVGGSMYACDHTIYINPTNVQFLFFSEEHKKIAISLSEQYLETKMLRLYRNKISVIARPQNNIALDNSNRHIQQNEQSILEDSRKNKLKGLLYGYYIGAYLSCQKEDVSKLGTLRKIQSVIAAIASNDNREPTEKQRDMLSDLLEQLSPIRSAFEQLSLPEDSRKNVWEFINRYFQPRKDSNMLSVFEIIVGMNTFVDGKDKSDSLRWIENQLQQIEQEIKRKYRQLSPDKSEIVITGNTISRVDITDEEEGDLFRHWVNGILMDKDCIGEFASFRQDLADDITRAAKDFFGNDWTSSKVRKNLNGIRNIIGGNAYEFKYDNGVVSSIASVILKGDSWEGLLRFMQDKGMNDYRIAFALYGEIIGFANLYSTFTDYLLNQDSAYVRGVYQEFHGQLYDERLAPQVPPIEVPELKHDIKQRNDYEDENSEKIIMIKGHSDYNPKYEKYIKEIQLQHLDNWDGIRALGKGRDGWKGLIDSVCGQKKRNINSKTKDLHYGQTEMFTEKPNPSVPVWNNGEVWGYIENLVPVQYRNKLKTDLDWFQGEYRKGSQSKFYSKASRENKLVIDAFCHLKEGKVEYFPKELRETIKKYLYSLYGVSQ